MKSAALLLLATAATAATALAQGPLTPPGAPAATMKSLDQIEARTAIPKSPAVPIAGPHYTISQPGSYYLTGNIEVASGNGITIAASNVTIDLNGFTLQGPGSGAPAGMDGISGSTVSNVVVRNGRIRNWAGRGLYLGAVAVVEDLNIENCGLDGIKLGQQAAVRRSRISACALPPNSGYGISVEHSSVVENCNAVANSSGILVTYGGTVRDCSVTYSVRWGIRAGYDNVIKNNLCANSGTGTTDGAGILATDANNRIEDNQLLNADIGLHLQSTGNYVTNNVVKNNTKNYDIAPLLGKANQLNLLLCQIPEMIEWPCSVRLAGSLYLGSATSNGITVAANDVTIDMGGHTLTGPGANSGHGIYQGSTLRNLRVFNGMVTGWGGANQVGVFAEGKGNQIDHVQASANFNGIRTDSDGSSNISGCSANDNTNIGIAAKYGSVTNSSASNNSSFGIYAPDGSVTNATASGNGSTGIYAGGGSVTNSRASNNGSNGIEAVSGSVTNSRASYNFRIGIFVGSGIAAHCVASDNSTDPATAHKEIFVSTGGQRDACVPASE